MECRIGDLSVYYETEGTGRPITHGYYVDHRLMAACIGPVFRDKDGFQRIYIDLHPRQLSQSDPRRAGQGGGA